MHDSSGSLHVAKKSLQDTDIVQSYLDALLRDITVESQYEDMPTTQVAADVQAAFEHPVSAEISVASSSVAASAKTLNEEFTPTPALQVPQQQPAATCNQAPALTSGEIEADTTLLQLNAETVRIMPDWARRGFAGLLFEVAGLKMAAPLHALGGISLIEDRLQLVVGQADWFMGLLRWNGRNLRVVDTARFVMPERLDDNAHRSAYQSVIVLGDSHWALAVDCADESVNLKAEEIRWKYLTGNRPWLAGTLLQRLCALLDVDNLLSMLQATELHIRDSQAAEHIN
jgi:purine-binding chemotaxis protein CheW